VEVMTTLRLALLSLGLALTGCGERAPPMVVDDGCFGRPQPWECGSFCAAAADKGPYPDAGVCESYRCVWPADGAP